MFGLAVPALFRGSKYISNAVNFRFLSPDHTELATAEFICRLFLASVTFDCVWCS